MENFQQTASYYLMKNGFILRLDSPINPEEIPLLIEANLLEADDLNVLNQEQANWRVALFRDEILEYNEFAERVYGQAY